VFGVKALAGAGTHVPAVPGLYVFDGHIEQDTLPCLPGPQSHIDMLVAPEGEVMLTGQVVQAIPAPILYLPLAHAAQSPFALNSKPALHDIVQAPDPIAPCDDVFPVGHIAQALDPVIGPYCSAGHSHGPNARSSAITIFVWNVATTNKYLPTRSQVI